MKKTTLIYLSVLLLTACTSNPNYQLVIQNVGVFDGEKDLGIVNLAINDDTIAEISKKTLLSDSIIDETGKYIVPGLVNSHVHMWEAEHLKEAYKAGVLANMGMHASSHFRDSF